MFKYLKRFKKKKKTNKTYPLTTRTRTYLQQRSKLKYPSTDTSKQ